MPKVFVVNDSGHDFSAAEQFGELVYLTVGEVNPQGINQNYRVLSQRLSEAKEGDYILVTGLASLNALTGWMFGLLGVSLRLLLFKNGKYHVHKLKPEFFLERIEEEKQQTKRKEAVNA